MTTRRRRHPAKRARARAAVLSGAAFLGIGTAIAAQALAANHATAAGTDVAPGATTTRPDLGGTTWYAPPVTSTHAS